MTSPRSGRSREPHWLALIALSALLALAISYVGLNDERAPWVSDEQESRPAASSTPGGPQESTPAVVATPSPRSPSTAEQENQVAESPVATPSSSEKAVFTAGPTSPQGSTDDSNVSTPQLRFWNVPPPDTQAAGHLRTEDGGLHGTYAWVDELSGDCQPLEISWFFTGIPSGAYDVELFTPDDGREASVLSITGNLSTTVVNQVDKKGGWTYLFTVRTREGSQGQTVLNVSARQEELAGGRRCQPTGRVLLFDTVRITRASGA